jgi:capsular polysaccharide biosynthesis protein
MTERDQAVMYTPNGDHSRPPRVAAFSDSAVSEASPADAPATGLVSLGYIGAAIGRSLRLLCVLAVVGVVAGVGFFVAKPPSHKAETSVLLTYGSDENPTEAVLDDKAIAQSHAVAKAAMAKLGVHESVGAFAAAYSVTVVTERVLQFVVSAPSSSEAVSRAAAIASSFLQFKAAQEETAQQVVIQSMESQLPADTQSVASFDSQISRVEQEPTTSAQQAELKNLKAQQVQAALSLEELQQSIAQTKTGSQVLPAIKGSVVLDPAEAMSYSKIKQAVYYAIYGLVGGLAIGLGIIVLRALASDRLRRRDDIARALGAPVQLSVGATRTSRRRSGAAGDDDPAIGQIAAHLGDAVTVKGRHRALAVVPVDDPEVAARSIAQLAISFAREGRKVMLADLVSGAPAAKLLGSTDPGVGMVRTDETSLVLAVPDPAEVAPSAPAGNGTAQGRATRFTEEIASAYASVDVLLTLVTLDPAFGSEHLATWADSAVAVVTAGRSSWPKLQAVGEMIRFAGVSLDSTVLVGADKSDESLGLLPYGSTALFGVSRPS